MGACRLLGATGRVTGRASAGAGRFRGAYDRNSERFAGRVRPGAATEGADVLARYAEMSGGTAFVVSDFGRLKQAADRIVAELAHQYRLGYEPLAGPSCFRRVEVRATRRE